MLHRWSARDTLVAAFDRSSYDSWVRDSGKCLVRGERRSAVPGRWGSPVGLPSWISGAAHSSVGDLLRDADPRPLTPNAQSPLQHGWLHQIQQSGRLAGELAQASAQVGLACHSPFLDQGVIEACLATPSEYARDPRAYKPLLAAAMRDVLPEPIRRRTSKDHCLPEWHAGLRNNQRLLAEWCDTSRLTDFGVIDRDALRRALLNPELLGREIAALEKTLATEAWLRDVAETPIPAYLTREDT
jgi:asparagine synthase (glutamine-hydrolysing)